MSVNFDENRELKNKKGADYAKNDNIFETIKKGIKRKKI